MPINKIKETLTNRPKTENNQLPRPITIFYEERGISETFRNALKKESLKLELTRNSKLSYAAVNKITALKKI